MLFHFGWKKRKMKKKKSPRLHQTLFSGWITSKKRGLCALPRRVDGVQRVRRDCESLGFMVIRRFVGRRYTYKYTHTHTRLRTVRRNENRESLVFSRFSESQPTIASAHRRDLSPDILREVIAMQRESDIQYSEKRRKKNKKFLGASDDNRRRFVCPGEVGPGSQLSQLKKPEASRLDSSK